MNYSASPVRQRLFLCLTPLSFGAKYEFFDKIIPSWPIQRPFSTHLQWDALQECFPWPHTSLIPFSLWELFEIKRLQTLRERTYIRYGNDVLQSRLSQKGSSAKGLTNKLRKRFQANEFFFSRFLFFAGKFVTTIEKKKSVVTCLKTYFRRY